MKSSTLIKNISSVKLASKKINIKKMVFPQEEFCL